MDLKLCFFCSKQATHKVWFSYTEYGNYQEYKEILCDEHLHEIETSDIYDFQDSERIENVVRSEG
jgi:hypothetical protein